jgi:hypothetical protein
MIDLEFLKSILLYDPDTGLWTWKTRRTNRALVGAIAGTITEKGYIRICINKKNYFASVLAWFYMTGEWPKDQVDHKDLNKSNNKWSNLREATGSQNRGNIRAQSNNTTGFKGVSKRPHGYEVNFRKKYLGSFKTPEEAHEVYKIAASEYYKEYARF